MSKKRILHVEDDPSVAVATARFLSAVGYVVTTVNDLQMAADLVNLPGADFDLYIFDGTLHQEGDGADLAAQLKKDRPDAKVIIHSAKPDSRRPDIPFVAKPDREELLVKEIRKLIGEGRQVGKADQFPPCPKCGSGDVRASFKQVVIIYTCQSCQNRYDNDGNGPPFVVVCDCCNQNQMFKHAKCAHCSNDLTVAKAKVMAKLAEPPA